MKRILLLFFFIPLLFSCRTLNPSIMFKTEKGYQFAKPDSVATVVQSEYKLAPFDQIEIRIFSNNGYKLVDITPTSGGAGGLSTIVKYALESDGFVKLPLLGRMEMKGMTIREGEKS